MQSKTTFNKLRRVFKSTALAFGFLSVFTGLANAQTYVNGNLSTGANLSGGGAAAPAGTTWSQLQGSNTGLGFGANITANVTLADDFIVPAGPTWTLSKVSFYAYSTGYAGVNSPFVDVRARIYNTDPSVGSPTPVWGNLTTNIFSSSTFANLYRTAATADLTRRIWKIDANVNAVLPPGTYWIEWQLGNGGISNFTPPSTIAGVPSPAGANSKQRNVTTNTFVNIVDAGGGGAQDQHFRIDYTTGPCTGTPTPGNTLTTAAAVCPSTPFTLSLQNTTQGAGLTYQWFSGPSAAGPFTPIAAAMNSSYTVAAITATTFYRATVTCGGNVGTSTPVQVTANPVSACYCVPAASDCTDDDVIENVKLGNLNKSSACSANGYANYTGTDTATIVQGANNPIAVTTGDNFTEQVGVWIDYDRSGSFEASEFTNLGATTAGSGGIHNGVIAVPGATALGYTRMRVRVRFSTALTGANACLNYTFGETEDYTVNIVPCVPATITTQPANTSAVCGASTSFSVVVAGSLPVVYWQFRPNATAPWQNVPAAAPYSGVNTSTLTINPATAGLNSYQYRAVFSGACTGADFSNTATLTVTPLVTMVNPTSATICLGSIQQLSITNTVSSAVTATFVATGMPVAIPDGTFPVTTSTAIPFTVSGIPAGSVIQNIGVRFSITHPYVGDLVMNLKAPNNQKLNLFALLDNAAGTNSTANFTNTTIDSISTAAISGAPAPRSGSYRAERFAIGNTNFGDLVVANTSWAALLGTMNGTWNINIADLGAPDAGSVTAASLFITYTAPNFAQGTWTTTRPGTIFTDAAATIPYTGTPATTVYAKPDTSGVVNYSVSFATPNCQATVTTIPITVRSLPTVFAAPVNRVICQGANTTFTSGATNGSASSIVWQVSTDNGATYTNVANAGVYAGATTNTLTITGAGVALNGDRYRLSALAAPCTGSSNSTAATLTVNPTPVIAVTASPFSAIYPGQTTTLSAAVSPNAAATYTWFRDGALVAGATANTLVVDVDKLGLYTVRVNDVNGCTATSAGFRVSAAANDLLFIYPSPNTGQFQVRFFSQLGSSPFARTVSVFDSKGSRIYSRSYPVTSAYTRLDVDLKNHPKGIYSVELTDSRGNRLKTGRVLVL